MELPDPKSARIKKPDPRLPYRLREPFLSASELSLYRALVELVGDRYVICPKVALDDIFFIVRPNENVHYFNKIFRKHVDFLLCEPESLQPAAAVQLGRPAGKSETRESDQFMEDLFLSAGLPLVHVPAGGTYDQSGLAESFRLAVARVKEAGAPRAADKSDSVPMCPVCGRMMVLRVHRHGSRSGREYYGCPDNPRCPGVVEIG